jgi:photosystem II stability/assembly factor-like uncharacterized protein
MKPKLQLKEIFSSLIFYLAILIFIIGFNFSDSPPPAGWYQQFMPDLGGRTISDITFIDSLTGFAVTTQMSGTSYILKSSNRGDNWSVIYSDTNSNSFSCIQFSNANTGYVGGLIRFNFNYHILKTTDGGISWSNINTPQFTYQADISVLNEDTIWFPMDESSTGGVFYTSNGGASWAHQLNIGAANPDRIYMYNAMIGFAAKSSGNSLYRTTDGGDNWTLIDNNEGFNDMYFVNSLTGWKSPPMKKTTNGGLNWITQVLPTGGNLVPEGRTFTNINRDTIWAGGGYKFFPGNGNRATLNFTSNGGDVWYFQLPDTSFGITNLPLIQFINKRNGWAYGTTRGIHTTTGGDTNFYLPVNQISTKVPGNFKLFQNYPNPFNPKTKIKYQTSKSGYVKLAVYDIQGRELETIVNKKQNSGIYEVIFDGSGYSSGVYFYSLYFDGKLAGTKKMLMVK